MSREEREPEAWKDIVGFEGKYRVSSWGRVMALAKTWKSGRWVIRSHPDQIMALSINRKGYLVLGLRKDGCHVNKIVHRLVAEAFIDNPENKPEVNHKDADKMNIYYKNLEWATHQENMAHAKRNNLMPRQRGEKSGMSKLTAKEVMEIRSSSLSASKLADKYNISPSHAGSLKRGICWNDLQHQSQQP